MRYSLLALTFVIGCAAAADEIPAAGQSEQGWRKLSSDKVSDSNPVDVQVTPGTRIPLSLINSVSTKNAAEGDRVYLETVFPILVNGRIVIPPGSYVAGTITQVKRPGRMR